MWHCCTHFGIYIYIYTKLMFNEDKSYFLGISNIWDPFTLNGYKFKEINLKLNNRQVVKIHHVKYKRM